MEASAREEGLLVDGAGAPLAEKDSDSVELLDGVRVILQGRNLYRLAARGV
jgi:hypothetical protein